MAARMTNLGFGRLTKPTGKPAEIPTPKVYDFTNGKRPVIPDAERSDLSPSTEQHDDTSPIKHPRVIDGTKRN